jgi:cytochrome c-type biogenesis protein CcmH
MTLFWIVLAGMILVALAMIVPVLLRQQKIVDLDRDRQNVVIARERLAELEQERDGGDLSTEEFEQAKLELEQSLLQDLKSEESAASQADTAPYGPMAMWSLIVFVPLFTVLIYLQLGSPQLAGLKGGERASRPAGEQAEPPGSIEEMIAGLAQKLEQDPENPEGWFMLGRSYMATQQYPQAAGAFQRVNQLVPDQPQVLLAWADALIRAQGGSTAGRPAELVRKAVQLEPDSATALWLAGMVEAEADNPSRALEHWRRLESMLAEEPDSQQKVRELIRTLEKKQTGKP